jgi:hypothetical protein
LNVKKKRLLSGWLLFLFLSLYVNFTNVLTLFLLSSRVALIPVCQQTPQALLHSTVAATKLLQGAEAHEEQRRSASKGSRATTTRAREQTKDFVLLQGNYGRCLWQTSQVWCWSSCIGVAVFRVQMRLNGRREERKEKEKGRGEERKKRRTKWVRTREEKGAYGGIGHRQYFRPNENRVSEKMLQKLFWCVS